MSFKCEARWTDLVVWLCGATEITFTSLLKNLLLQRAFILSWRGQLWTRTHIIVTVTTDSQGGRLTRFQLCDVMDDADGDGDVSHSDGYIVRDDLWWWCGICLGSRLIVFRREHKGCAIFFTHMGIGVLYYDHGSVDGAMVMRLLMISVKNVSWWWEDEENVASRSVCLVKPTAWMMLRWMSCIMNHFLSAGYCISCDFWDRTF